MSKWGEGFVYEPVQAGLRHAESLHVCLSGLNMPNDSESSNYLAWRYNAILIEVAPNARPRSPAFPGTSLLTLKSLAIKASSLNQQTHSFLLLNSVGLFYMKILVNSFSSM